MPLVHLYYKGDSVSTSSLSPVVETLQNAAATALSLSDQAQVSSDDITVVVLDIAKRNSAAFHDIEIIIWAHAFPERIAAAEEIATAIAVAIQPLIPVHSNFFVWVLLSPTGFQAMRGSRTS